MKYLKRELKTCIITAGGEGTRLKEITKEIPKPLFPINGISCLERSLKVLSQFNIRNVIILSCYKKNLLIEKINYYESKYNLKIKLIQEDTPLGECGGLWLIKDNIEGDILLLNSDLVWDIDINRFFNFHVEHDGDATLFTHICGHPKDSDLISESANKQINSYSLKPHKTNIVEEMFLGNSGIALFKSILLKNLKPPTEKPTFCDHILSNIDKFNLRVFSYNSSEFVKDIGTPKRFFEVQEILKKDMVRYKSYLYTQRCLFIDRDNTLIECPETKYITKKEQLKFLTKNIFKIAKKRQEFDLAIIITNQPQISMGLVSWEEVISINSFIIQKCLEFGLKIDSFNLCPHHYHSGFKNEIIDLKQDCFCRKPKPGLFFQEAFFRNINLSQSLMIGDSESDKIAAEKAGCEFLNVLNLT